MHWSDTEIKILKENNLKNIKDLAILLPSRTINSISHKLYRLNFKRVSPWTSKDIEILRENFGKISAHKISHIINKSESAIYKKVRQLGLKSNLRNTNPWPNRVKYSINEEFFSIPNIINSYWAGFLAGDGCIQQQGKYYKITFCINTKDRKILEKFVEDCKFTGPIKDRKIFDSRTNKIYNQTQLCICCGTEKWINDLSNIWNIRPKKTFNLLPPNLTLNMHKLSFICGILDADGSIIWKNNRFRFQIVGTYEIMRWISDILYLFEDRKIYKNKLTVLKAGKIYVIESSFQRALNVLNILNNINTPFKLKRKWDKIKEYQEFVCAA